MTAELDAGPVYAKQPLSLHGSAREIFQRVAVLALDMMERIVREEPDPEPQHGPVTRFARRKPDQSLIPRDATLNQLHDHIRMLDADGYPHAFIDHGPWRAHFSDAQPAGAALEARVRFERRDEERS
jgi:methionyl-tRNA formyltransferase